MFWFGIGEMCDMVVSGHSVSVPGIVQCTGKPHNTALTGSLEDRWNLASAKRCAVTVIRVESCLLVSLD